ncbi:hypothetical protein [Pararhizobium polonicum]|nr:hypothetical protein [Pararhizobium polonicum]
MAIVAVGELVLPQVIALANKMAPIIWAILTKQEDYRDPAMARLGA